jgi:hypothetical protein
MAKDSYRDGAAYGEAPHGTPPQGQRAGEAWPGNGRQSIDRSNPNPSMPDKRIDALYATIEKRDHMKRDAGSRMAKQIDMRNPLGKRV